MSEKWTVVLKRGDARNGFECKCAPDGKIRETSWKTGWHDDSSAYRSTYTVRREDLAGARLLEAPKGMFQVKYAVMRVHDRCRVGDNGPPDRDLFVCRARTETEAHVPLQALAHHFGELPAHLR